MQPAYESRLLSDKQCVDGLLLRQHAARIAAREKQSGR